MANTPISSPEELKKYGITAAELEELKTRAMAAKEKAYCPYSHFRVGATLLTSSPTHPYVSGANVENASYPVGVCAERCALGTAVGSYGLRRGQFRAVAVATDVVITKDMPPTSPCGMCRQGLREFMDEGVGIWMFGRDGAGGVVKSLGETAEYHCVEPVLRRKFSSSYCLTRLGRMLCRHEGTYRTMMEKDELDRRAGFGKLDHGESIVLLKQNVAVVK